MTDASASGREPGPAPDPAVVVDALLAGAGLPAGPQERASLVGLHALLAPLAEALHAVRTVPGEEPATGPAGVPTAPGRSW